MKGRLSLIILVLINLIVDLGGSRMIFTGNKPAMIAVGAIFVLFAIALLIMLIQLVNENDWLRKEVARLKQLVASKAPEFNT